MSLQAGRGRRWFNLGYNSADMSIYGGLNLVNSYVSPSSGAQVLPQYEELVRKVKDLNMTEDEIMFNTKNQQIQIRWKQTCATCKDVEQSLHTIHNLWLYDMELASKLVTLIASPSSMMQDIQEYQIRNLLLERLQNDFETGSQIQTKDPAAFRNCVHMLGGFYSRARLADGAPYHFLAEPFTKCLELLLRGKTTQDYSLFTTQWYLNGSSLYSATPEEVFKLSLKIRNYLSMESLSKECKLWILLALDLQNVRFGKLTAELYQYYENLLGNSAMKNFQRSRGLLSIQTVQSNMNVLQGSSLPTESTTTDVSSSNSSSNGFEAELQLSGRLPTEMGMEERKGKPPGRPILGRGAGLNKNEDNGTPNESSSDHDDQFDNGYSIVTI